MSAAQRLFECVAVQGVPPGPACGANLFGSRCEPECNVTDLLLFAAALFPLPRRIFIFLNLFITSAAAAAFGREGNMKTQKGSDFLDTLSSDQAAKREEKVTYHQSEA